MFNLSEIYENLEYPEELAKFNPQYGLEFEEMIKAHQCDELQQHGFSIGELSKENNYIKVNEDPENITEVLELKSIIEGVNPNYNPEILNEWAYNCGSCAFATYLRLRGIEGVSASSNNIGSIEMMEDLTSLRFFECSPEDIKNRASSMGEGWHGILGVMWNEHQGHWLNLFEGKSGLYVLDSQINEVTPWNIWMKENPACKYYLSTSERI